MARRITIIIEDDGTAQGIGYVPTYPSDYGYGQRYNDPCQFCQNNPAVNPHASGVCNCALPALANPIWW